ncbi:MAG: hypothetical protein ACYCYE_03965 [Clostridia bacterium]
MESSRDVESAKPRKYYLHSEYGGIIFEKLCAHCLEIVEIMNNLINSKDVE